MKNLCILLVASISIFTSCSHKVATDPQLGAEIYLNNLGPAVMIGKLGGTSYKHMSFAAQPTREDLVAAKAQGYQTIINVRDPAELDWDVAAHVQSLGMSYYNVPLFDKSGEIDVSALAKLEKIHLETHKQKQLIFCSSGNRAAAWFAAHLMIKHHLSASEALKVGRKLGITRADIEKKVENLEPKLR